MPGRQFQFDEDGDVFYCFFVAFYTLCLVPLSYYLWPKIDPKEIQDNTKRRCHCLPCQNKRNFLKISSSKRELRRCCTKMFIYTCWFIFCFLIYQLSHVKETVSSTYDPFQILGIDRESTQPQIRRAYKQLSLKHHPDKGGDEKLFISISKAYASLTNEDIKKNWMEYGNPDGPETASYGIALPKWLVMKENKYLVIAFYVFLFILVLPIAVGTWWYNTVKYSVSNVLLVTRNFFLSQLMQNQFPCHRSVIQLISRASEFSSHYNKDIIIRSSDNLELSSLLKQIPLFTIFKKAVIGSPYAVKAKALIYAHLRRIDLPPLTLRYDKDYIIKHCPKLITELIDLCAHVLFLGKMDNDLANKAKRMALYLTTLESFIDLPPMLFQAMSSEFSPFMQLPHFSLTQIRAIYSKAKNVKTIQQLASLEEPTRRNILSSLTDEQYSDVINVLSNMPQLEMEYLCEVFDDMDKTIRPMSVITCRIWLKRSPLISDTCLSSLDANVTMASKNQSTNSISNYDSINEASSNSTKAEVDVKDSTKNDECEIPVWDRSKKGIKQAKQKNNKSAPKKQLPKEKSTDEDTVPEEEEKVLDLQEEFGIDDVICDEDKFKNTFGFKSGQGQRFEDEDARKRRLKAQKEMGVCSHTVHCPYFPAEKFEGWWVYLVERRNKRLIGEPVYVSSLQNEFYLEFKFFAPSIPGSYQFNLMVRSDCYVGFDYSEIIKFNVEKSLDTSCRPDGCCDTDSTDEEDEENYAKATQKALLKRSGHDSAIESSSDEYVSTDEEAGQTSSFLGIF